METGDEGSGAAVASFLCMFGALQGPMAAGIRAGLVSSLVFGCTLWLDEVPCVSRWRDCSGRSGRCR